MNGKKYSVVKINYKVEEERSIISMLMKKQSLNVMFYSPRVGCGVYIAIFFILCPLWWRFGEVTVPDNSSF